MSYTLNEKIRDLQPYDPITGSYQIRLDANESFLPIPEAIHEEMNQAIAQVAFNRYPDPTCQKLCEAFADYYGIDSALVTAGNGSDELISLICTAFLMKGEKVLTVAPDFSMYQFYTSLSEAETVVLAKEEDLSINVDRLIAESVTSCARMIIFSNPCNPTSLGLQASEVRRLIKSVNALVVLDEAYMDFWDQSLLQEVAQYDNLIILRTSSKAVGGAAIRLGFAVANPTLTRALRAVKSPYNVNTMTQVVGTCLFSHPKELEYAKNQLFISRDLLYYRIKELQNQYPDRLKTYSTCTNFVFIKMPQAKDFYSYLLKNGVAIRYMGDYVRITAGSEAENQTLLHLFQEFLSK